MTGSLFNNYLVTNLEMSQSIANGTFTVKNTGIPQDNIAITAYSASYYTQLSGLGLSNQMCPSWGQLYAANASLIKVTINPEVNYYSLGGYYVIYVTCGNSLFVDTNVVCRCAISYTTLVRSFNIISNITIVNGDGVGSISMSTDVTAVNYVNILSISPLCSSTQRYLIGPPIYL